MVKVLGKMPGSGEIGLKPSTTWQSLGSVSVCWIIAILGEVKKLRHKFECFVEKSPSQRSQSSQMTENKIIKYIISFIKVIYWKLTVPVLPSWTSVFPRTLNLCREHTTKYSP